MMEMNSSNYYYYESVIQGNTQSSSAARANLNGTWHWPLLGHQLRSRTRIPAHEVLVGG